MKNVIKRDIAGHNAHVKVKFYKKFWMIYGLYLNVKFVVGINGVSIGKIKQHIHQKCVVTMMNNFEI